MSIPLTSEKCPIMRSMRSYFIPNLSELLSGGVVHPQSTPYLLSCPLQRGIVGNWPVARWQHVRELQINIASGNERLECFPIFQDKQSPVYRQSDVGETIPNNMDYDSDDDYICDLESDQEEAIDRFEVCTNLMQWRNVRPRSPFGFSKIFSGLDTATCASHRVIITFITLLWLLHV